MSLQLTSFNSIGKINDLTCLNSLTLIPKSAPQDIYALWQICAKIFIMPANEAMKRKVNKTSSAQCRCINHWNERVSERASERVSECVCVYLCVHCACSYVCEQV